jgi:hypothetical protein
VEGVVEGDDFAFHRQTYRGHISAPA